MITAKEAKQESEKNKKYYTLESIEIQIKIRIAGANTGLYLSNNGFSIKEEDLNTLKELGYCITSKDSGYYISW